VVLTENRRQNNDIDRQALADLRTGNAESAVRRLVTNGRITLAASADAARQHMVNDWLAARQRGDDALMFAVRRSDVHELNRLARTQLVATRHVEPAGFNVEERTFAVGDRVMTLSNRRRLGVVNGARGTITTTRETGVTVHFDRGADIALPASYLHAGHLTHAYAMTLHKAQGMTCERGLVLANDALFQEAGYTALSRGRTENRLYVVDPDPPDIDVGHGIRGVKDNPIEELVAALEHSRSKHLAIDDWPAPAVPTPTATVPPPDLGIDL
jgi:ATP-dependent exoDNAse (exonuclease V) alpha subunit